MPQRFSRAETPFHLLPELDFAACGRRRWSSLSPCIELEMTSHSRDICGTPTWTERAHQVYKLTLYPFQMLTEGNCLPESLKRLELLPVSSSRRIIGV